MNDRPLEDTIQRIVKEQGIPPEQLGSILKYTCFKCGSFMPEDLLFCDKCVTRIEQHIVDTVPDEYRGKCFWKPAKISKIAHQSLFITGVVGGGKTQLVWCIYEYLYRLGYTPRFRNVQKLLFKASTEFNWLRALSQYTDKRDKNVLILDDLGSEVGMDKFRSMLLHILDERKNHQLKTIITSNLSIREISDIIDARIASRINSMCITVTMNVDKRVLKQHTNTTKS